MLNFELLVKELLTDAVAAVATLSDVTVIRIRPDISRLNHKPTKHSDLSA